MNRSNAYLAQTEAAAKEPLRWDRLRGKRVLITGASGLIGTALVDILAARNALFGDGIHILAMGRSAERATARFAGLSAPLFGFIPADLCEPLPPLPAADYILHAASNTHPRAYSADPVGSLTANVLGTHYLLEAARRTPACRFVLFSSVEVYGAGTKHFKENAYGILDCNTSRAAYPEGKRAAEALCNAYAAQYGVDFTIARLARCYGPTMARQDSKAQAQFLRAAAMGQNIILKSDGSQRFSYCYAVDAAAGVLAVMLAGEAGAAYNVADRASESTLLQLAQRVAAQAGVQVLREAPDVAEKTGYSNANFGLLDSGKLEALGWRPLTGPEEGIRTTLDMLKMQTAE